MARKARPSPTKPALTDQERLRARRDKANQPPADDRFTALVEFWRRHVDKAYLSHVHIAVPVGLLGESLAKRSTPVKYEVGFGLLGGPDFKLTFRGRGRPSTGGHIAEINQETVADDDSKCHVAIKSTATNTTPQLIQHFHADSLPEALAAACRVYEELVANRRECPAPRNMRLDFPIQPRRYRQVPRYIPGYPQVYC